MSSRCPGRARHWRVAWGTVGVRRPVCIYCGSPNPRPLTEWEWEDLIMWSQDHSLGDHVRSAVKARQAEQEAAR